MILLDTNVVSEVMKARSSAAAVAWLNGQESDKLYISVITIGEIVYGLRILPEGQRRSGLRERFEQFITLAFDQRVLSYDESAARIYGELMGTRNELGLPMIAPDGQIAAIARHKRLSVATRSVEDFENCGIEAINPFDLAE